MSETKHKPNPYPLSKSQRKAFFKVLIGLKKWTLLSRHKGLHIRFLTLTSSIIATDGLNQQEQFQMLHNNFQVLRNRLQRNYNLEIKEYFKTTTNEINGTIHIIYIGDYIPENLLINEWNEIHASQILYIENINLDSRSLYDTSRYLVSQYLTGGQHDCISRYGHSKNWVYPGFVNDWENIKKSNRSYTNKVNVYGYQTYTVDIEKSINSFTATLDNYVYKNYKVHFDYTINKSDKHKSKIKKSKHRLIGNSEKYKHLRDALKQNNKLEYLSTGGEQP
jgi:hypothetical protein